MSEPPGAPRVAALTPWRMVVGLGFVSLAADMVADGGRSILGPLLGSLGASALVIGVVMGAAEAVSLILRLVAGPLADRSNNHWNWTVVGYGLTVVCVPLLAVAPAMGAAGLAVAVSLLLLERAGKAVRSPSKTALLAHAAGAVGRGRGFGVHKTLDLVGAVAGPLVVAAIIAATGAMEPALLALVVPGVVTMVLLVWLRRRVPDPSIYDGGRAADALTPVDPSAGARTPRAWWAETVGASLPREFFLFAVASALITAGLVSYGISSYHLVREGLVPLAAAPVVFAGAMGVAAVAALATGAVYDRRGPAVLLALPLLVAAVPPLVLAGGLGWALAGMAGWGAAVGIQEATVKALVADLVPAPRRASAYGVFAAFQGVAALAGGVVIGGLYEVSVPWLSAFVAACQIAALALLLVVLGRRRRPRPRR
jgi:MFS family permease